MSIERRRTKYGIYADMVEVIAKKGLCSLTRISYGANLPVDRAKKNLDFLVSHGFVKEVVVSGKKKYRAIRRGLEYLETFKRMRKFFAALEEHVIVEKPEVVLPGRITTGYEDLDNLLLGGIPQKYAVILTSPSCDERELLIKAFLEGGAHEQHITFFVTTDPSWIKPSVEDFGLNFYVFVCNPQVATITDNLPNIFKIKGVENLTEISIALTKAFSSLNLSTGPPRRICIEIISDVLLQHHAVHTRRWLVGLLPELKSKGFTVLAVMNPQMHSSQEVHAILGLFEGEINIYEKETEKGFEKFLKIKRMYNQNYQQTKIPLKKQKIKT